MEEESKGRKEENGNESEGMKGKRKCVRKVGRGRTEGSTGDRKVGKDGRMDEKVEGIREKESGERK